MLLEALLEARIDFPTALASALVIPLRPAVSDIGASGECSTALAGQSPELACPASPVHGGGSWSPVCVLARLLLTLDFVMLLCLPGSLALADLASDDIDGVVVILMSASVSEAAVPVSFQRCQEARAAWRGTLFRFRSSCQGCQLGPRTVHCVACSSSPRPVP